MVRLEERNRYLVLLLDARGKYLVKRVISKKTERVVMTQRKLGCTLKIKVLPIFAWVKSKVDRTRVSLLCKEGRRGGNFFTALKG